MIEKDIITEITEILKSKLQFEIVAISKGYVMQPLVRKKVQPYIIFKHSDKSISYIKQIMFTLGINLRNINDFLRSQFDPKTGDIRWYFTIPDSYSNFTSEMEIIDFWIKFKNVLLKLTTDA